MAPSKDNQQVAGEPSRPLSEGGGKTTSDADIPAAPRPRLHPSEIGHLVLYYRQVLDRQDQLRNDLILIHRAASCVIRSDQDEPLPDRDLGEFPRMIIEYRNLRATVIKARAELLGLRCPVEAE